MNEKTLNLIGDQVEKIESLKIDIDIMRRKLTNALHELRGEEVNTESAKRLISAIASLEEAKKLIWSADRDLIRIHGGSK